MPYVGGGEQVINLTPFLGNARWELEFNIAVFIPFGFYLAAVTSRRGLPMKLLVTLVVSLLLEFMQFVLAIGRSDVTDLMMNVVGGAIGIVAYYLFAWMLRKRERVPTLVVCLLLTLFEFYMTISFIFFGQLDIGFMIVKLN